MAYVYVAYTCTYCAEPYRGLLNCNHAILTVSDTWNSAFQMIAKIWENRFIQDESDEDIEIELPITSEELKTTFNPIKIEEFVPGRGLKLWIDKYTLYEIKRMRDENCYFIKNQNEFFI
jgi:hypothetical protein